MLKLFKHKLWDLWCRDPWLVAKYVTGTLILGVIGKAMLIGAKDGADVPLTYAQFIPTIPMMMLTFVVHRYLWKHQEASIKSYVGKHWSASYGAQFVAGHSLFMFFAVLLGWQYVGVSVAVGFASAITTFAYNEWRVFKRRETEAETT